ncbi:hypothetical protein [Hymenobacter glacieicola]|uniref:hypothetical protein n=1 Tax=Hymenobacter glacieicola TaxID=1562124 RepID=UPI001663FDC2|nr:hypothetical protein [Hymenobacter glacieicola]
MAFQPLDVLPLRPHDEQEAKYQRRRSLFGLEVVKAAGKRGSNNKQRAKVMR